MFQFAHFLTQNVSLHPDSLALVFNGRELSWGELDRKANRLANSFLSHGIHKGDVVAYLLRNRVEIVLTWWATQKIGAIAQPLNTFLLARELATSLNASHCKALVFQDIKDYRSRVQEALAGVPSVGLRIVCDGKVESGEISFSDFYAIGSSDAVEVSLTEDDGSLLLFTSGTTGMPKGVLRSHRVTRDYALMLAIQNENVRVHEVLMTHCPLFHTAGMSMLLKAAVLAAPLVLVDGFDEREVLALIERYQVTQLLLIPPVLYLRLRDANDGSFDLSCVKEAQCSGGTVTRDAIKAMHELFPQARFRFSWGSTETCAPTSATVPYEEIAARPEICSSIGKLNTMVEMKLVNPETGKNVATGEVGEAHVRSSMVFSGYLHDEEKTRSALDEDGWFKTADLLREDDEGYYYLVGRTNDMIKSGGENVYASEVEKVVNSHPAVRECAVIGVADKSFGEAVAIAVVLHDGCLLDASGLSEFCQGRLANYKKPRYFAFIDELPRNSVGKLLKSVLRDMPEGFFTSF
ncbi:MAG: acyl--CoA ligase [Coriobacteriales bacterium]|jgi:long-chain acyl-CoA synthetase|nr:acyl--CoA ligase [Coriobacteriales bacterium]